MTEERELEMVKRMEMLENSLQVAFQELSSLKASGEDRADDRRSQQWLPKPAVGSLPYSDSLDAGNVTGYATVDVVTDVKYTASSGLLEQRKSTLHVLEKTDIGWTDIEVAELCQ